MGTRRIGYIITPIHPGAPIRARDGSHRDDGAFTITAITMLELAIGLNVTVFAVMKTMQFRGFPLVKQNDRLLYMLERFPELALSVVSGFWGLASPSKLALIAVARKLLVTLNEMMRSNTPWRSQPAQIPA